jgi:tripartite-type tricarboxylate transporter receptor subunit TctC
MKFRHWKAIAPVALSLVFTGLSSVSSAQQRYPTRPVTFIVPASAGGPSDAVARILGEAMTRGFGQQVIVENAGGAGGSIGSSRVARAKPDGYTLLLWHIAHATAPALYEKLPYNVLTDFEPIGRVADAPMTLISRSDHPAKTIGDLLAWIREKKADATYGHAGAGTSSHLCGVLLSNTLNVPMTGIPYKGTGPAMNDLIGKQFDVMCDQTTNTTGPIKSGRVLAYAAATPNRLPTFPDLPTLSEAGLPGFEVSAWHGLWAPKGTPKEVAEKLVSTLQEALKDPKVVDKLSGLGVVPVSTELATPAALRSHHEAEVAKWGAVIKAAGIKAE